MTGARLRGPRGALGIGEALQLDVPDELIDALTPGQHIHHGQYLIHGVLGRGSFATVYDAEHLGLARRVAIKVPLLHVDKQALLYERFVREARTAALVQHPNVLAIYDSGSLPDGTPFLVLERVDGDSLSERIAHGPLSIALVIEIGLQLAMALSALAAAGIVHRDIKPANVMLHRDAGGVPQVKLVDLGVAKRRGAWQQPPLRLTMQGELIGTPQYMASEQLRGEEADSRTDIYGVAAVLYEALTGQAPHESSNFSDFMVTALSMPVVPVSALRADCPPALEQTVLRGLERDREQRQASAEQLVAELELCKSELETIEVELDELEVELELDLVEPALASAEAPPALEPARPPIVSSAPPPELPPLWQVSPPEAPARGWLRNGERTLPTLPRLLIGLALLLSLLGGSGALMLPSASLPEATPPAAQATPAAVEARGSSARERRGEPALAAPDNGASDQAASAVAAEPALPPPPSVPFAPRVELPEWQRLALLERAPLAPSAEGEPHVAREPTQQPLEEPLSARDPQTDRPGVDHSLSPSDLSSRRRAGSARMDRTLNTEPRGSTAPRAPTGSVGDKRTTHAVVATVPVPSAKGAALGGSGGASSDDPQAALAGALKAFATGRLADAKAAYQQVLRSDAGNTAGLRGLGLVAARLGENDVARKALSRYLELAPRAPDAPQISSRLAALAP